MSRRADREEPMWELTEDIRRASSPAAAHDGRRHSSSASSSSQSTGASGEARGSAGRRSRPSVSSVTAALATVREQKEQRSLSWKLQEQRPPEPRIDSADTIVSPELSPDSEETVLSSKNVLTNFEKVASRDPDSERRRREQVARYGARDRSQQDVYQRLKRWADKKSRPAKDMMLGLFSEASQQPPLPKHEELVRLAKHYYPPRGELKVHVCDFGLGRAEHHEITLGEVEEYWQQKPDWVDVRWIHAPLGIGLAHSSIEDIFLHDGEKGREFVNAGRSGWPYMETEVLNFRSQENFQEMRDVYLLLNELQGFEEQMEEHIWDGDNNSRYAAVQLHNSEMY